MVLEMNLNGIGIPEMWGGGGFYPVVWENMVVQAANSRNNGDEKTHQYICKVLYPGGAAYLELKTNREIQEYCLKYGSRNGICAKLGFSEVINFTRRNTALKKDNTELSNALDKMAGRAEKKYNSRCIGSIRKILSAIINIFTTNNIFLFASHHSRREVAFNLREQGELPFFIGSNVKFARMVTEQLRAPRGQLPHPKTRVN